MYIDLEPNEKVNLQQVKKEISSPVGLKYFQNGIINNDKLILTYQLLIPEGLIEAKKTKEIKSFFDELLQIKNQIVEIERQ
ncbi:hypothetical protein ACF3NR_09835 [Vaginella massiliensis]|uniref:hypothetical protein n=1 Tax=Vaginella massiliensis TaxID=1816680 RepID=UPI000837E601|nr:hypothetical protein [Vaginella massiliensis]